MDTTEQPIDAEALRASVDDIRAGKIPEAPEPQAEPEPTPEPESPPETEEPPPETEEPPPQAAQATPQPQPQSTGDPEADGLNQGRRYLEQETLALQWWANKVEQDLKAGVIDPAMAVNAKLEMQRYGSQIQAAWQEFSSKKADFDGRHNAKREAEVLQRIPSWGQDPKLAEREAKALMDYRSTVKGSRERFTSTDDLVEAYEEWNAARQAAMSATERRMHDKEAKVRKVEAAKAARPATPAQQLHHARSEAQESARGVGELLREAKELYPRAPAKEHRLYVMTGGEVKPSGYSPNHGDKPARKFGLPTGR